MFLSLYLILLPSVNADIEMTTSTYKQVNCGGQPIATVQTHYCSDRPDARGFYVKTVCSGQTYTTTGFEDKSCRGTPRFHEVRSVIPDGESKTIPGRILKPDSPSRTMINCENIKDEETKQKSTGWECVIPEEYSPSPSGNTCCKTCPGSTCGATSTAPHIVLLLLSVLLVIKHAFQ